MSLRKPEKVVLLRKRDGDDCSICNQPMNFDLPRDHPRAPTIDHVIPKAAGGRNALFNCKLAHFWPCNAKKGAVHDGVDYAALANEIALEEQRALRKASLDQPVRPVTELVYTSERVTSEDSSYSRDRSADPDDSGADVISLRRRFGDRFKAPGSDKVREA